MRIALSPEDRWFLAEVKDVLGPFRGLEGYVVSPGRATLDPFYKTLAERNWLSLSWPKESGGLGETPLREFLLWNHAAFWNIARPPQGVGVIAKTIIRHGTTTQKDTWLPKIRSHDITFALAYSEPEAGSDLAHLRCRAAVEGKSYVVTGNKCWNSKAHEVDYLWLLCRTGGPDSGKRGLTILIVDVNSPGVRIRPIRLMDGNFVTEIFLDEVRVPTECRIGPENEAWTLITEALADERYIHFSPGRVQRDFQVTRRWLHSNDALSDPVSLRRMDDLAIDVLLAEAHALRVLASKEGRAEAAANKVAHVHAIQEIARAALEVGGIEAMLAGAPPEVDWRQSMTESIGGGTTEIMEGIVARSRLGLMSSQ